MTFTNDGGEVLRAKITKKSCVYIKSIDKNVPLSDPVYAINWFNARFLWLYNFYNLIASSSVKKIGGKPLFKAHLRKILAGDDEHRRDVLLIVNYPSAIRFKDMLESLYFKLASVFRLLAVKEFTFGFTQCAELKVATGGDRETSAYTIHHYRSETDITGRVKKVLVDKDIAIHYAGRISSLLFSGDDQESSEQVPCLMDGVIVLEAESFDELEHLFQNEDYKNIVRQTDSSFIATLDRVL